MYDELVSRYQDISADTERPKERKAGIKRKYQLRVVLFTQARKQYPNKEPFKQDEAAERIVQKISRKHERAKHKGLFFSVLGGAVDRPSL